MFLSRMQPRSGGTSGGTATLGRGPTINVRDSAGQSACATVAGRDQIFAAFATSAHEEGGWRHGLATMVRNLTFSPHGGGTRGKNKAEDLQKTNGL